MDQNEENDSNRSTTIVYPASNSNPKLRLPMTKRDPIDEVHDKARPFHGVTELYVERKTAKHEAITIADVTFRMKN